MGGGYIREGVLVRLGKELVANVYKFIYNENQ